ncbi:DEP domain-containing mTOR-interacting protein [Seminavis robusta]|uniref:DEP domain-containing mTOR-interacting protein n=1 Tax=Seminavis robusta TaxID=568900 RepID=A0A9N8H582_9STRA|nr:DEP domain-containing mTOR-interacting protein [Seminavis robusta]|eukprot:Sro106_g053570.1 DEP domain-containing mTOR-interacting protein (783) ;mRNA; f:65015-67363
MSSNNNNNNNNKQVKSIVRKAVQLGAPMYNSGDIAGCYNAYVIAAKEAANVNPGSPTSEALLLALQEAEAKKAPKKGAWVLRKCFDLIMAAQDDSSVSNSSDEEGQVESLSDLLARTIAKGSALFNQGDTKGCYEVYFDTAKYACMQEKIAQSTVGQWLEAATDEAMPMAESKDYAQGAWILRRCFDDILKARSNWSSTKKTSDSSMHFFHNMSPRKSSITLIGIENPMMPPSDNDDRSTVDTDGGYWQDEKIPNTSDWEIGTCIADFNHILRGTIQTSTHKRFLVTAPDSFVGSDAVHVLTSLGLAPDRDMAVMKCQMLVAGSFMIPIGDSAGFQDGTHLYRFSTLDEMKAQLEKFQKKAPHKEGSQQAQLTLALQITLREASATTTATTTTTSPLQPLSSSTTEEQQKGVDLAKMAQKAEQVISIKDRTHLLKTYPNCFVGKDAVATLVQQHVCRSKEEAIEAMKELHAVGLIHHVLYHHGFENKQLFYRFTAPGDLRKALDAIRPATEVTRHAALVTRYQQHVGALNVTSILNSFFGCTDKEGWDVVDLQNWRNNMKRWGFGRREDQDDVMVERLAPLALTTSPEEWWDGLTPEEQEEWTSPWGILAQVAIFDQVPRSAFRGTPDAFKWDDLAIKASKLAIERGYFDTAYKSTLNQFLVLLPLEHSESWEDQKLGVSLLLKLLSTVAIQDEGLSDYEIVKRLEFSKRLATAFLEHAQVIAKFKHYPHRNGPLGRTTTLEERVWLASDLVPRWAKSQNPEDASKNVIQLPVIPLKKLTRG